MPVAAKPWLWGLLVVLLLGLVVMHHAPKGHASGHDAAAVHGAGPAVVAAHDGGDCPADAASATAASTTGPTSTVSTSAPTTAQSPLDLLHLCLAIAAAAVALFVPFLSGAPFAPASPRVAGAGPGDRPRPPQIPRRLAALGVLRL